MWSSVQYDNVLLIVYRTVPVAVAAFTRDGTVMYIPYCTGRAKSWKETTIIFSPGGVLYGSHPNFLDVEAKK